MSECPIHRVELLLGRCWMCRGVPPGGTPNRPPDLKDSAAKAAQSPQEGAARGDDDSVVFHSGWRAGYAAARAEFGRSTSDRPPVNPPVASADPELAALLREARNAIDELHGMYAYADLLARIDSALSRLAGQSATANASGGAARGSPEEER
jgi:hypothetical protein